ncbi:MAG TPA: DUF1801 domain-containing protein [Chitinophagales bacterium]|nr:DUF1801 domain-containing protein [Chitinophagales bacterium]
MTIQQQIKELISSQPEPKQTEMQELHKFILHLMPKCRLWYFDGKNEDGKQVAHPTIGYGNYTITYKDGSTREFFRIALLANPTGLAVHIMGIDDKKFLIDRYSKPIGKAKVGSYAITFKSIKDINLEILKEAIQNRIKSKN